MSTRISNSVRRGTSRVGQKPANPIPRAPSSRQIVLLHTSKLEERPRSAQREPPTSHLDIRNFKPVLRRKERGSGDESEGSIDPYKAGFKGAKTSRGSSIDSDPDTGPHTTRTGSQQPVVGRRLLRSFTGEQGKENVSVEQIKQPKCDVIQHHRGLVQPRPLSTYVLSAKSSKFTTSPVAVPACMQNSFYHRLNSLEEQLERDLSNRRKMRIPKGFFADEEGDSSEASFM